MRFTTALLAAAVALGSLTLLAPRARAQYFGTNKVHYERLHWSVLETPHIRLHYYAQEESLARGLAAFAESTAVEYDGRFRVHPRHRVPILLYSAHQLFQQTNATPEQLTEGVGGLTELIKGRVLVPHTGSWARLRWVTRHELTHAYQLEKFGQVMHAHHRPPTWFPPLWFTEGLAEHCATTWDADAEGLLRDMVCSRMAYPVTRSESITGSVEMYKEGQNFLDWLSAKYGDARIFDLLDNAWRADDFETVFALTYGRELRDVDDEWFFAVQRRYFPVVADHSLAHDVGRPFRQPSRFNLAPRVVPSPGDPDSSVRYCYFAAVDGAQDLMLSGLDHGKHRRDRRLVRGGGSPEFESFHLFENRPGASVGGHIVVSAKRGGRDALHVIDVASGRVERVLEFPELISIHDPSLLPGDHAVIMSAQDMSGSNDLYRVTWDGPGVSHERLERLTHDSYDDLEPAIAPDGGAVTFASDRAGIAGHYALFRLALSDGAVEQVSFPDSGDDRQPAYSPDGRWLVYRSTRAGTSDLYVRSSEPSHSARRLTRMIGPVSDPDWTRDGRGVLCTVEERVSFRTWAIPCRPESLAVLPEGAGDSLVVRRDVLPVVASESAPQQYQRRVSVDLLQDQIVHDPTLGTGDLGQIGFSDVLGNEQYRVTFANDSQFFGEDFWSGWEVGFTYFNQAQRLNYGMGVYRLTETYNADFDQVLREPRVGTAGFLRYPLSHFDRLEASVQLEHSTNHLLPDGTIVDAGRVTNDVSFVHDNTRWTWDGPIAGMAFDVSAGFTRDLTTNLANYETVTSQLRAYRRPLPFVVLASRAIGAGVFGRDAQHLYVGGPTTLLVPERRALSGLQAVIWQEELRFPLVRWALALPTPAQLPTVGGALFANGAWIRDGDVHSKVGVLGFATYLGGGIYPALRWNWVWTSADMVRLDARKPTSFFSIGYNF